MKSYWFSPCPRVRRLLRRSRPKFTDLISKHGTLGEVEEWGKRKLAYPINYETEGYYVIAQFSSEESFPAELDRVINITDGVLRSLIVAKGE